MLLKIIGSLAVLYLAATQTASSLFSNIDYTLQPINRKDFGISIVDGLITGRIKVRLVVTNNGNIPLTANQLIARLSQSGQVLGSIITTNPVELPAKSEKQLSFDVKIPAGKFLDRLQSIFEGGVSEAIAPVDVNGSIQFSTGQTLTINRQIKFLTVE